MHIDEADKKTDLMWGIKQMEIYLAKNHDAASNIMNICTEVINQTDALIKLSKISKPIDKFSDTELNTELTRRRHAAEQAYEAMMAQGLV